MNVSDRPLPVHESWKLNISYYNKKLKFVTFITTTLTWILFLRKRNIKKILCYISIDLEVTPWKKFLPAWRPEDIPTKFVYILIDSMLQDHSSEAIWFAGSQAIPRISSNPKVHYRTHRRPLTVSILGQSISFNIPTSNLLEIRPNNILPSTPRSPWWFPSLRWPQQDPIQPLFSSIRATCPAHLILSILSPAHNLVKNMYHLTAR